MKILFVCQGNINRSQMAGVMLKATMPEVGVTTAGVAADHAGKPLDEISERGIATMKELGYDMSKNMVSQLNEKMVDDADKVILMGELPDSVAPDYLANSPKLETWDVPDPGYGHISHAETRDMIVERVRSLVASLQKFKVI
jgi:protein-tyrosine-phosphatase